MCEACIQGKMHRTPHQSLKEIKSTEILQHVHTDVCSPKQTKSFSESRYFITFTQDCTRCCKVYFLNDKSEAFEKFKEFKATVEKESGQTTINALKAYRGGEYLSRKFSSYLLKEHGIRTEFTAANTPQQNEVSERLNWTTIEAARSMLSHAGLKKSYWAEAVATAAYLLNRMVNTAITSKHLTSVGMDKIPTFNVLRVFGCTVYSQIPDGRSRKLDFKAQKLTFIGYTDTTKNNKSLG